MSSRPPRSVEAFRQALDKFERAGKLGGPADLFVGRVFLAVADMIRHRDIENLRLLRHKSYRLAQTCH